VLLPFLTGLRLFVKKYALSDYTNSFCIIKYFSIDCKAYCKSIPVYPNKGLQFDPDIADVMLGLIRSNKIVIE